MAASPPQAARRALRAQPLLLLAGLACAVALRTAVGQPAVASSQTAALIFTGALVLLWSAAGFRPARLRLADVALGGAGAVLLVGAWWFSSGGITRLAHVDVAALAVWSPVVAAVAVAEEAVLRGALFESLQQWTGTGVAFSVTTVTFALMHVPLYGWTAMPLDLAVGALLGALRIAGGTWAAPAVAHALADLAGGWLA